MAFFNSDDVANDEPYDGEFELSAPLAGPHTLRFAYVEDVPIPWIYSGINEVVFQVFDGSWSNGSVSLPEYIALTNTEAVDIATRLADAMTTALGSTVTCLAVLDATAKTLRLTFNYTILLTGSALGLMPRVPLATPSNEIILDVSRATSRPVAMGVTLSAVTDELATTAQEELTLVVPLVGDVIPFPVHFEQALAMRVTWSRLHSPSVACPMDNQWMLGFVPS